MPVTAAERAPRIPGSAGRLLPGRCVVVTVGQVRLECRQHQTRDRHAIAARVLLGALPKREILVPDIHGDLLTHPQISTPVQACTDLCIPGWGAGCGAPARWTGPPAGAAPGGWAAASRPSPSSPHERELYRDQWVDLRAADVELPDGRHLDHRFLRVPPGAGAVVLNDRDQALLIWRHRFITGAWNYEIPMGGVETGEQPIEAAAREVEEETGWRPGPLRHLLYDEPMNGLLNACNHIFLAEEAEYLGAPSEAFESDRIAWVPLIKIPELVAGRQIIHGSTIAALLLAAHERGI